MSRKTSGDPIEVERLPSAFCENNGHTLLRHLLKNSYNPRIYQSDSNVGFNAFLFLFLGVIVIKCVPTVTLDMRDRIGSASLLN